MAAYERGDSATAIWLLQSLAEQGDSVAQFDLCGLYVEGQGAPPNLVAAYMWIDLGLTGLSTHASSLKNLADEMTHVQIVEAENPAAAWRAAHPAAKAAQ